VSRNLLSRAVAPLVGQAVFSATTFASGAIVARTATAEQFGLYALVVVSLAWACGLQGAAVTTPYTFCRQRLSAAEQREFAGAVLLSQLGFAALVAITLTAFAAIAVTVPAPGAPAFAAVLSMAGVTSGIWLLRECCRQLAIAHGDFASAVWLDVCVAVLQLGGLLAIAWRLEMTAPLAFATMGAAALLPTAVWLVLHRDRFSFALRSVPQHARTTWRFGRWIVAGVFVHALAKDSYPWILTAFHGPAATATFAAALGIAALVNPLMLGASNALRPAFARIYANGGAPALRTAVGRYTRIAVVAAVLYCGVMFVAGDWFAATVYGAQYAASGRIAAWLAVGIAASFVTLPVGIAAYAQNQAKITFQAVCVGALITIAIGGPLVARFIEAGAAAALLLANAGESIAKVWAYRRVQRRDAEAGHAATVSA
jgi:O-antigen/teichoic acid export membrane protein